MIVDFHAHIFPDKIANKTVQILEKKANIPSHSDGTYDGLISSMRRAGVKLSVNLPVLTSPSQFDSILKFATAVNERFFTSDGTRERILSFAGMHPDIEEPEEKLRAIKESGILGIKIHPDYQSTFFDDEKYVRILAEAKRLGLITVTHAGFDAGYPGEEIRCTPMRVMRLLDKIGGYDKLVLAHFGGNRLFTEVYEILAGEDVYFDTACVLGELSEKNFSQMIEKHGEEKILFATDSPWRDLTEDTNIIKSFSLGESARECVFSKNALALLGI